MMWDCASERCWWMFLERHVTGIRDAKVGCEVWDANMQEKMRQKTFVQKRHLFVDRATSMTDTFLGIDLASNSEKSKIGMLI